MRDRLALESPQEREARLRQVSAQQHERLAKESVEEREARLRQLSAQQRERLATESVEEREARLRQLSAQQCERFATESVEERESRLRQLSIHQHQRLTVETVEEREQCARQRESDIRTSGEQTSQLFTQPSVQEKMRRFHSHIASLTSPKCSICLESFPELQLPPLFNECARCIRDKHIPKMYSSANNMDPGSLPTQLQVSSIVCYVYLVISIIYKQVHGAIYAS